MNEGHTPGDREVAERVASAVEAIDGLSLFVPLREHVVRFTGRESTLAVTLEAESLEIRLVAHRLPLPPLLDQASGAARAVLVDCDRPNTRLRLVVHTLAADAFTAC